MGTWLIATEATADQLPSLSLTKLQFLFNGESSSNATAGKNETFS